MMTSSNGNIFRVTGLLCGEFTGPGEFPTQRPVTWSFDVFFDLRLGKRLSKQPRGWWFETSSWSLWRHCNVHCDPEITMLEFRLFTTYMYTELYLLQNASKLYSNINTFNAFFSKRPFLQCIQKTIIWWITFGAPLSRQTETKQQPFFSFWNLPIPASS